MPNTSEDPVDHARTTRQHAGETMKDGVNAPGLIAVGLGVVALVVSLFAFATSRAPIGASALIVALVLGGGGLAWLALEHRRVRHAEHHWHEQHPAAHEEPPTS